MDDPDGKDDLWEGSLGRTMEVPVDRPVDVIVGSRDVLHSFSLPNFRTKLDTVPGMMGKISFTPTTLSRDTEVPETVTIEQMQKRLADARSDVMREWMIVIDENSPGAEKDATGWRYAGTDRRGRKVSIIRHGGLINYVPDEPARDTLSRLKDIGVNEIRVYRPGYFDIACQELCGQGHYSMKGQMYVIPADEYERKYETPAPPAGAASVASAARE
jgi:hypothetical protein